MLSRVCLCAFVGLAVLFVGDARDGLSPGPVQPGKGVDSGPRAVDLAAPSEPAQARPVALPAGVGTDWWSRVQEDIRRNEYSVTWQEKTALADVPKAYQAPNRAHNLRTYFTPEGIRVVPRTGKGGWQWGLKLSGYGYEGAVRPAPAAEKPTTNGNRIEYKRGDVVEWYVNDAKGLEQGFTIAERPEGTRQAAKDAEKGLRVEMEVTGDLSAGLSEDHQSVDFTTDGGVRVVNFGKLQVADARGRALPARFELRDDRLSILVNDVEAQYPVTIDPLATSPSWTAESDQANADFGWSVSTAGDVNGDGYSDIIVGAPRFDNGHTDEGRAYVYYGSADGIRSGVSCWPVEGNQAGARFGRSVGTAGDVNGDGYSDVIVGAPFYDNGQTDEGQAYIYYGGPTGLSCTSDWTAESNQGGANFGWSVSTAGDVNGDGYSDVILGAPFYDNGQVDEGRAFVYYGSPSGPTAVANWTAESNQADAGFGYAVSTAGDVNGDGYSDIIVGAPRFDSGQADEGLAIVYHGSASGLTPVAAWTAESNQAGAEFGRSVCTAGDVNGDGYSDVIVGAPLCDNGQVDEGRAFVYRGGASGLNAGPTWTAESNQAGAEFGTSVSTAGDVNGDGYGDVIVGAYLYDGGLGQIDEGRTFVYSGGSAGLSTVADWTAESDQAGAWFGYSVSTAGDINGDGYSDVIVGAYRYDNGETNEGRSYVYLGEPSGLSTTANWTAEGDQADAEFGYSVSTAGDINGDGYSDVIVGAHLFDNGQADEGGAFVYHGGPGGLSASPNWTAESDQTDSEFGRSVGTTGDVNGDGYSDVIVGARQGYNGQGRVGRAFVYHGSASGLSTIADWMAESDQVGAEFGCSVSTAGDVNGDGYSDVIVGAWQYFNDQGSEGRAYVYHGSAAGLSATANWTTECNQGEQGFGESVSTAGDVNGDGYADVIVGSSYDCSYTTAGGAAYVYHGGPSGLSPTANWTAGSNQLEARFGRSVSTAGDVNGDGFCDVIVGAHQYDNGETNEGRAFAYHGSPSGLSASPNWTAESDQAGAWFGYSVSTAGDINGDGFCDVIVGAYLYDNGETTEGRAFAYHGSPSGLSASPNWTAESDQAGAWFGYSVSTAGDINGDGYSDVIVGARHYDNGETIEGRSFVYYGNAGGLDLRPQQRRADDTAPVGQLNASESTDSFRLAALGRTPFGRGSVKLQWEVKPLGAAFDGTGLGESPSWYDTGTAGTDGVELNDLVTGLTCNSLYHWRLRVLYNPVNVPWQAGTRWVSAHPNGWEEADLRTPAPGGDLDDDGDVDGFDFLTFSNCFNGSNNPPQPLCGNPAADLDHDSDVDGFDFLTFSNSYNGSNQPPRCP